MTILKDLCTKDNTITPCFKSNPRNTEIIPFTIPAIIQHSLLEVDRQRQSVRNVVRSSDHSSYNMQLERISSSPLAISRFISLSLFLHTLGYGMLSHCPNMGNNGGSVQIKVEVSPIRKVRRMTYQREDPILR